MWCDQYSDEIVDVCYETTEAFCRLGNGSVVDNICLIEVLYLRSRCLVLLLQLVDVCLAYIDVCI